MLHGKPMLRSQKRSLETCSWLLLCGLPSCHHDPFWCISTSPFPIILRFLWIKIMFCNTKHINPLFSVQQHAAWIIPFFCYQIFDFALNTLVAVTILVYPNSIQEYIRQLVRDLQNCDVSSWHERDILIFGQDRDIKEVERNIHIIICEFLTYIWD